MLSSLFHLALLTQMRKCHHCQYHPIVKVAFLAPGMSSVMTGSHPRQDTGAAPMAMEVEGCTYTDAWGASGVAVPVPAASGGARASSSGDGGTERVFVHTGTRTRNKAHATAG
ncbi:uncharacterized protein BT62DRAFT_1012075 [Guyanagaster necrorhizus]|uniref:Uncharacterized protein n=1 Tax=Guyanagaster necrorhizus TaxID=856835 RepID=A0A9P7VI89_9AGAR|nr:uncharacterized protein BT62DRAFT_1012075 [Guyanagaster necrorhizus MCA 3950]KAG7441040.1 hypothetical protein BT62DRAFT_1012075 [Guyanagaster necrorhizus MCA 3950]